MSRFKNKRYRLLGYNYGWNGTYFVTICTKNKAHYFGLVQDALLYHTTLGVMACECWRAIPKHFPFVKLGAWVVMPNHVHGIIIIDHKIDYQATFGGDYLESKYNWSVSAGSQNLANLSNDDPFFHSEQPPYRNKFGPQSKNLASVVRGFKVGVTKFAVMNGLEFEWQRRFHDRILWNKMAREKVTRYIEANPRNWPNDPENS